MLCNMQVQPLDLIPNLITWKCLIIYQDRKKKLEEQARRYRNV